MKNVDVLSPVDQIAGRKRGFGYSSDKPIHDRELFHDPRMVSHKPQQVVHIGIGICGR